MYRRLTGNSAPEVNRSRPAGSGETTVSKPQYVFAVSDRLISESGQNEVKALAKLFFIGPVSRVLLFPLTGDRHNMCYAATAIDIQESFFEKTAARSLIINSNSGLNVSRA